MNKLLALAILGAFTMAGGPAFAADAPAAKAAAPTCDAQAAEKKLSGAAQDELRQEMHERRDGRGRQGNA